MKRSIAYVVITFCFLLTVPSGALADTSGDEKAIRSSIKKMWKMVAAKQFDSEMGSPAGGLQATSEGGFWQFLSREEFRSQINDSPNTLDFSPHHIQVMFLGSNKDVAHVAYYLAGTIKLPNGEMIRNYRTRASMVMEKMDGKWVSSVSHYSPLFGGSGVVLE